MSPRSLIVAFPGALLVASSSFACGSSQDGGPVDASTERHTTDATAEGGGGDAGMEASLWPTPPAWNAKVPRPASDTAATAARTACQFKRGDMPAATVDPSFPLDVDNPIENIVVLMQENRSFDTYMGHLYKYEGVTATDIDSAPDTTTNPNSMGQPEPYQHAPQLCFADTDHSWHGSHEEWDNGKNDGFYVTNNGTMLDDAGLNLLDGDRSLWWYDQTDIPFYYSLYSTFAISDSYFCGLLGPTWPNRMYLYAATSLGETSNVLPDISKYPTPPSNLVIFDELAQRGVSFGLFTESSPGVSVILGAAVAYRYGSLKPVSSVTDFLAKAKAGTMPQVSFLDPNLVNEGPGDDDEHPPAQIQVGEDFVWKIVNAITTSPQWAHTALFITYDEHGGEYDHVPPPDACAPDAIAPILYGTADQMTPGDFKRYGFRVPIIAISPYSKKGYVSHTVYSHTSITRFIEAKFKIPALTARDANADPFSDMFDWTSPPFVKPPTFPEPTVNESAVTYCEATYPVATGL
jgi:phospholipase C